MEDSYDVEWDFFSGPNPEEETIDLNQSSDLNDDIPDLEPWTPPPTPVIDLTSDERFGDLTSEEREHFDEECNYIHKRKRSPEPEADLMVRMIDSMLNDPFYKNRLGEDLIGTMINNYLMDESKKKRRTQ